MKNKLYFILILAYLFVGCNSEHDHEHDHESHEEHAEHDKHDEHEGHEHQNEEEGEELEDHEDEKIQFTAYSSDFEVFAEADVFVTGETSNILSHFSKLPSFSALENGSITIRLVVNKKEIKQTLEKPDRKGIYSFNIKPETAGKGQIIFDINTEKSKFKIIVPNITVFQTEEEAHHEAHEHEISLVNTTVFTKEQSWKIDFSTELPKKEPFGQVIKTTAQVQSAQGDEIIISAKTSGIVKLSDNSILEGKKVSRRQVLFSISGSELADNNISVRYTEAKNNFEKAKSDYERANELAKDKIVSEKELQKAKNSFDNAKATYYNLNKNFNSKGQNVTSPMTGFIKYLFVKNGTFVTAGQAIATISMNKTLILSADVQEKHVSILGAVNSANIRTVSDNKTYSLKELNGHVLSYGKSTNNDNYLIPIKLQIDNKGGFTPGSFVEIYLKTLTNSEALTIPNTALSEEQGVYFVYVQITPELFEKREVEIGATDGLKTEILKGISFDERIVSKGSIFIKLAQATGTLDAHSGHVH